MEINLTLKLILSLKSYFKQLHRDSLLSRTLSPSAIRRSACIPPVRKTKKAYYLIIIISSIWLVLTEIPYYSLNILNLISNGFKEIFKIHVISSIFFNSNYCINFIFILVFILSSGNAFLNHLKKFILN